MIPFVTRRENELPTNGPGAYRLDPLTGDWTLELEGAERCEHGWLWQPCPNDPTGPPRWKELHPIRHRDCIDGMRCQVCAGPADRWVIPTYEIEGPRATTTQAPLCAGCVPIAFARCPHLRGVVAAEALGHPGWHAYRARPIIAGVVGDLHAHPTGEIVHQGRFTKRHRRWREVVARQRLVRLYDLEPIA